MPHLSKLLSHAANESLSHWPTFTFTLNLPFTVHSNNNSPNSSTAVTHNKTNEKNNSIKKENIACESKPSSPLREHPDWITHESSKTDASIRMIHAKFEHKEYSKTSTTIRLPHPSLPASFTSDRPKRGRNYSSGSNSILYSSFGSGSGNQPHRAQGQDDDEWVNIRSSTSTATSSLKNSRHRRTSTSSNSTASTYESGLERESEPEGIRQTRLNDGIANRILSMPLEDVHDEIQHSIWAVVQRQADGI
ncbi:hypothetical protein BDW71DRAFT_176096 [Aspergillus fruticulosus]